MLKISEILSKAQKDSILLMDLFTDVEGALEKHNVNIDSKDLPDLKKVMKEVKSDLIADLTRLQVTYAEDGRWGGIGGVGL